MILAAHQPNFCPWLSFFSKLDQSDIFVILINVQFEKNNWQNRCQVNGRYWTKPIERGLGMIKHKYYVGGSKLDATNMSWIKAICMTLDIDMNKIVYDYETELRGTERLVNLCNYYKADKYLTNPAAAEKYLDCEFMEKNNIKVVHHETQFNLHVFEAFEKWGIQRTIELMKREKSKTVF